MKLVSWNVAGLRACLKKGFIDFFNEIDADIFCLQEVKAEKNQIEFDADHYYEYLNPADRKGYSGTMIYTKEKPLSVKFGLDPYRVDDEGRAITLEYEKFYIVTFYAPNSKSDLSRLEDRMSWEDAVLKYLKELEEHKPVIVCGDLNVAHKEIDIKNPSTNHHSAGFTDEERDKMTRLLNSGFIDTYRYFYPNKADAYSWWSYFRKARERNSGWRIDYFLISEALEKKLKTATIYSEIIGSDHCPIGIEINLGD